MTMKLIQTVTISASGGQNAIEFVNIPQTYDDLMIVYLLRSSYATSTVGVGIIPNGAEYPNLERGLYGNGSGVSSTTGAYRTIGVIPGANLTSNTFGLGSVYVANYTSSSMPKIFSGDSVAENNGTTSSQYIGVVKTANNNPITSLSLADSTSGLNLIQHSTASLYGIIKGSGGASVS